MDAHRQRLECVLIKSRMVIGDLGWVRMLTSRHQEVIFLFDHLVGGGKQHGRYGDLNSLEIDHEIKLFRSL
jgi:hypothetical protein